MVRSTAREMAGAVWEEIARDNGRLAAWRGLCHEATPKALESRFIALMWPHMVEQARATLAHMLSTNIPESLKESISHALILDNTLRWGPKRPPRN